MVAEDAVMIVAVPIILVLLPRHGETDKNNIRR